jgi:FMN phosphatase YigB (HAD superfamily)
VNNNPSSRAEGFDAWLVDLDGTLYRQGATRLAMALELLLAGPRKIRVIQRFRQEQELLRRNSSLVSEIAPYQLQLNRTAAALGETVDSVAHVVHEWMEQRPCKWLYLFRRRRLLAEIAAFRRQGGKTAVVSDYPATTKLVGLGAADLFDVVVACGEQGGPLRLKPSPEGYLLAAARLGVAPSRCLIIGDRDDADGEAARQAQMAYRRIA